MSKVSVSPSGVMFPNPVILVSSGQGEEANIMTVAWAGTACGNPWMVSIAVRPATHSHGLLMRHREFVVNVPTVDMLKAVEICGTKSGRECNKWVEAGLKPEESQAIRTPGIAECPISMECRVRHTLDLGLHTLFVGEVVQMRRERGWLFVPPVPVYVEGKYYGLDPRPLK